MSPRLQRRELAKQLVRPGLLVGERVVANAVALAAASGSSLLMIASA